MTVSKAVVPVALEQAAPAHDLLERQREQRSRQVQRGLAVAIAFTLGLHLVVHGGVTVGDVAAPVLLPVWVPTLARYRGAFVVVSIGVIAAVWGWLLGAGAVADGYALTSSWRLQTVSALLSVALGAGVLLWARSVVPIGVLGAAFGLGMLVNATLTFAPSPNAWKFTWAVPVSVLVLSLASLARRRWIGGVALLVLAAISAVLDCRSYSAALLLALLLYLALARPATSTRQLPVAVVAGFVVALAGAVYNLGTSLLVSGYLGKGAQARTVDQIHTSGSLILGGRPEISATWALMRHRPGGYGAGVVPNGHDVMIAKTGLRSIGYAPDNNYVEKYMFGGHIELHSTFGDLWSSFGVPGLVFTALVAVLMVRGIATCIAQRTGSALLVFGCVWTLWNVGFSPFASSSAVMTLALAAALPARRSPA